MAPLTTLFILFVSVVTGLHGKLTEINSNPPHCTHLTKSTDYQAKFKYDYPTVYIPPGQREAYQRLFCINPPTINNAVTMVCDWAAPPQVQYTLGDEYMHVVRQDPTGRYLGNAVITTQQLCNHNRTAADFPIDVVSLN
ncbi:uncharacterized protein LOC142981036 [Anticarsia gemmatalis]|uniref:uncharacterized protein LOC142981036 n=1 Tax=Anticarsia gemmatalis TaxID=129554 RepID=UPI003F75F735